MENSEQDNPSYIQNALGKKGLDFWVDYNGNITTWFNQDWNMLFNLYIDSYETLVEKTFCNPITDRFLKKGFQHRNAIISEVSSLSVLRSLAVNLRDYAGALVLEESKVKLYWVIRSLQEYLNEYAIETTNLENLSNELQTAISLSRDKLSELFESSNFDILDQYMDDSNFDKTMWEVLFILIKLGHYIVDEEKLRQKIEYYSLQTGYHIKSLSDFNCEYDKNLYEHFHKRISFMKPEAYSYLFGEGVN
jgi:hypothetical protein